MLADPLVDAPMVGRIVERRKRKRVVVSWPIRILTGHDGQAIETHTVDISSEGVYFLSSTCFPLGQTLVGVIEIPVPGNALQALLLRSDLIVLRVEKLIGSSQYGIACRIVDYSILKTAANGGSTTSNV